ncbi:MAG: UPF0104 family protein [Calditrichaeota bacterium]|nr:MAG: UPF0104 family protein [Calditrichota bacterium]
MKRALFTLLRVAVSLGLLGYLISLADVNQILAVLGRVNLQLFVLAVAVFFLVVAILTFRWFIFTRTAGYQVSYPRLFVLYLIGYFFNNFLPTTIGGDLSRAYYLSRLSGSRSGSVGIILMERLMGLAATLTMASVALLWTQHLFHTPRINYLTGLLLAGVVSVMLLLLHPRLFALQSRLTARLTLFDLGLHLQHVMDRIHQFRTHKGVIAGTFLLSLSAHLLIALMNLVLARALHLDQVQLRILILLIPVTFVLGLLPSINGLGVRDSGYVFLLVRMGLDPAEALALSFLNTLVPMLVSFLGGIAMLFYRHSEASQTSPAAPEP